MKRIFNITLALSALLCLFSCAKYGSTYDIPEGNPCVSFPSEDLSVQLNNPVVVTTVLVDGKEMKAVAAELWRGNTQGSATIKVDIEMDDETAEVFTPEKSCFEFQNGENKAYIYFTFNPGDIEKAKEYNITLSIAEEDSEFVSPSGIDTFEMDIVDPLTLIEIGTATVFEDFWFGEEIEATLYKAEEIEGYYVIKNALCDGYDISFTYDGVNVTFPSPLKLLYDEEGGWYTLCMLGTEATIEGNVIAAVGESWFSDWDEYYGPINMTITLPEDWNK